MTLNQLVFKGVNKWTRVLTYQEFYRHLHIQEGHLDLLETPCEINWEKNYLNTNF